MNKLKQLITKQKAGIPVGIYSACSANAFVIEAVLLRSQQDNSCVLIEATANQVDQYGGYTGMKPEDFKAFVYDIADRNKVERSRIYLGGDHLGPLTFAHLEEEAAMEEAAQLVSAYVAAGFTKIHLDTSMKVASDDANLPLATTTIARRGAQLAAVANKAYQALCLQDPNAVAPVYIIGSEVPIPGGGQEEDETIQVTTPQDLEATLETFYQAFKTEGIEALWNDVIGVVVQPGVEFSDTEIHGYDREAAKHLIDTMKANPNFILEGHSTDYQTPIALKEMVEDGIAILKVGPALTFALREALFSLSIIEAALYPNTHHDLIAVLEQEMLANPKQWQKHYHGDETHLALSRKYSFSDRARYYLVEPKVDAAIQGMITQLAQAEIPLTLLSQYMPLQYRQVRAAKLAAHPVALLEAHIIECLETYLQATKQEQLD
ncbi:MAG: class II D-tagatose-bisphosphate aldolase non-catalytic subunit [Erysipelotrichaceae bacterium]